MVIYIGHLAAGALREDSDEIADAESAGGGSDHVPAEKNVAIAAAEGGQSARGFVAPLAGVGIDGGTGAARAGFDEREFEIAGADGAPGVFRERFGTGDHDIGTEAAHVDWLGKAAIQIVERGLVDEQERKTVGEADADTFRGVDAVDLTKRVVGLIDEATGRAEKFSEPGVGGIGGELDLHVVFKQMCGDARRAAGQGNRNAQSRHTGSGAGESARAIFNGDERHAGQIALRKHDSAVVYEHPAAVAGGAAGIQMHLAEGDSAGGFERVDVELGDEHIAGLWLCYVRREMAGRDNAAAALLAA